MLNHINEVIEAAEYLNDTDSSNQLKRIQKSLNDKTYLLTVMGQFSAGKSKLINNLIGKTILPVHITETTALITFIRYSETECANIFYEDGSFESVPIDKTFEIWQNGEYSDLINEIEHIDICVNCDLLKNGLIIADTPGVNTIIEKHVELATNLMSNSDRIIYVMGKSLTDADKSFVQSIITAGIKIIFVRTHMDELKADEENVVQTITAEEKALSEMTEDKVFFVSNETGKPYNDNINNLRTYLSVNLAEKVEEILEKDTEERVLLISNMLINKLSEKRLTINQLLQNKKTDFSKRKNKIQNELSRLEKIIDRNKENFNKKYESVKNDAKECLNNSKSASIKTVSTKIRSFDFGESVENYSKCTDELIRITCIKIKNQYVQEFDNLLAENKATVMNQINEFSGLSEADRLIPDNLEDAENDVNELTDEILSLNELKKQINIRIEELKNESSKNDNEKEKLNAEVEELEEAAAAIKQELDEYPDYVPQYIIQEGNHSGEKAWGTVGKILDIGTLFIPGKVWANVGAKALSMGAKAMDGIGKATKVGSAAVKAAGKLGKAADVVKTAYNIEKADKIVDGARLAGRILTNSKKAKNKYMNELEDKAGDLVNNVAAINGAKDAVKNEQPSFFDYFTIDYYFKKIGRKFDTPDVTVLDREHEEKYYAGKKEITQRLNEQYDQRLKRKLQLIDANNKDQVLKAQQDYELKKQQAIEANIKELEEKIKKERINSKKEKIRNFYVSLAEEKITDYCAYLISDIQPVIDEKIAGYLNTYDLRIVREINRQKSELSSLEEKYNSADKTELENEMKLCQKYTALLKNKNNTCEA